MVHTGEKLQCRGNTSFVYTAEEHIHMAILYHTIEHWHGVSLTAPEQFFLLSTPYGKFSCTLTGHVLVAVG